MILTITEIKHVQNSTELLNEFGTELNLDSILTEELNSGLPCDINNAWQFANINLLTYEQVVCLLSARFLLAIDRT